MEFKISKKYSLCVLFVLLLCALRTKADNKDYNGRLCFMTYNVHSCIGMDKVLDPNRIAEVIRQSGADIIGLQEVENNFRQKTNFQDQPRILAKKLGMYVVFGPGMKNEKFGNVILSKYPILESKNHILFNISDDYEQRSCVEAKIKTPAGIFKVFCTHIDHSTDELMAGQIKDVLKITDCNEKMILLGDFNEQAEPFKAPSLLSPLMSKYGYVFDIVGMLETTTVVEHNRRFDHIFVSRDLEKNVKGCFAIKDALTYVASDHFPVIAVVQLPPEGCRN
jgi:endonuclease/exonuclease/phosphatase family metal-dependent hydrolase